jgi:hypothetical protein
MFENIHHRTLPTPARTDQKIPIPSRSRDNFDLKLEFPFLPIDSNSH